MKVEKTILRLIILTLVISISANAVHCIGVGISPTVITLPNVLRGGYAESDVILSNPTNEEIAYLVEVRGQESWFSFEPFTSGFIGAGETLKFKVIAQPPSYVPIGNYSTTLTVFAAPTSQLTGGGSGAKVIAGVAIPVSITLSDIQLSRYVVNNVIILLSEECYPINVYVDVQNNGNVRATPNFHMLIIDANGTFVKDFNYTAETLLPTVVKRITVNVPYELSGGYHCIPTGEYTLVIESYLGNDFVSNISRKLEVLERGAITIRGNLTNLSLPANTSAEQLTKISANFTNIGQIEVGAKLKAEFYMNDTLADVVEGDIARIAPQESAILTAYFTPKKVGTYEVHAWGVFEGKTTDVIKSNIVVFEKPLPILEISILIIVIIAIISAVILWKRRQY